MVVLSDFYKNNDTDTIWWVDDTEHVGLFLFSFDKKRVFNLFRDYPDELSPEQLETFNRENPYWKEFFRDRLT